MFPALNLNIHVSLLVWVKAPEQQVADLCCRVFLHLVAITFAPLDLHAVQIVLSFSAAEPDATSGCSVSAAILFSKRRVFGGVRETTRLRRLHASKPWSAHTCLSTRRSSLRGNCPYETNTSFSSGDILLIRVAARR